MGIDIKGTKCKLWKSEHPSKDGNGKWFSYTVGVSRKNQDGTYLNAYQDVEFSRNAAIPDEVPNGADIEFEGFMTCKPRRDKDGRTYNRPYVLITKAVFPGLVDDGFDPEGYEALDDDIPFN